MDNQFLINKSFQCPVNTTCCCKIICVPSPRRINGSTPNESNRRQCLLERANAKAARLITLVTMTAAQGMAYILARVLMSSRLGGKTNIVGKYAAITKIAAIIIITLWNRISFRRSLKGFAAPAQSWRQRNTKIPTATLPAMVNTKLGNNHLGSGGVRPRRFRIAGIGTSQARIKMVT